MTRIGAILSGLIVFLAPLSVSAKPLPTGTCVELAKEHATLLRSGVEVQMENDPAQAGNLLKPEEMANIQRFLFIEGQLRFRCPEVRLPRTKDGEPPKAQAAEIKKNEPKEPSGPTVPLPSRKPMPRSKRAG